MGFLTVLVMAEFVLGNFANAFIVLVNYNDWIKRQKFSLVDQIIMALAVSRFSFLCALLTVWFTVFIYAISNSLKVLIPLFMVWSVSYHFSIWLATSLSIFYLLKITNFSSPLFLYLKEKVKGVIFIILIGSLVLLLPHLLLEFADDIMWMNEYKGNRTVRNKWIKVLRISHMSVFTLQSFLAFMMSLTSFVLLIFSLWKHLKNMQVSGNESQDPSTKVHIRAIKTMTSYLLLFTCHFGFLVIPIWNSNRMRNASVLQVFHVLMGLYPSIDSIILIWGNKKLKQSFLSFLCYLWYMLRERK